MTIEELTKIFYALKTAYDEELAIALYTKLVQNVRIDKLPMLRAPEFCKK